MSLRLRFQNSWLASIPVLIAAGVFLLAPFGCQSDTSSQQSKSNSDATTKQTSSTTNQEISKAKAIENILAKDRQIFETYRRRVDNGVPVAKALNVAVSSMQEVNFGAVPKDFRVKYFDHYRGWRDYYRFITGQTGQRSEGIDPEKLAQLGQGAARLYAGDPSGFLSVVGAASDEENQGPTPIQRRENQIYETYMKVQRTALLHGASISEGETSSNRSRKGLRIDRVEVEPREWDEPALFEEDNPPDLQLQAYAGGELVCQTDVVEGYSLSPQCTIYPSSSDTVLVRLYDLEGENREATHIGSWKKALNQIPPQKADTSFGGVLEFQYSIISNDG